MKKLILSALLFSVFTVFSQDLKIKDLDSLSFVINSDNLINLSDKKFTFIKYDTIGIRTTVRTYANKDNTRRINLYYWTTNVGKNVDLETEGEKKWTIYSLFGNFLDIYPIWFHLSDKKISKEDLAKKGYNLGEMFSIRREDDENGIWSLSFKL